MFGKKKRSLVLPETSQLEAVVGKAKQRHRLFVTLRSIAITLVTVSAAVVLVAMLWLPVFQITGSSMTPNLNEGEIVVAVKDGVFQTGDMVAFYYNNKILVKRVIAQAGDWVNINEDGVVSVNDITLQEPYVRELSLGDCNIEFPYQVPESRVFVMGDHRSISVDSRNTAVGCVAEEQIVGRLVFRVWPLDSLGSLAEKR